MDPLTEPLTEPAHFLDPSNPALWAGLSAALAIFLLTPQFRRLVTPLISAARGRIRPVADSTTRWVPTLQVSDRRSSFRRRGNPVPIILVGLEGNRQFDGRVLDRSRTGVRVEAPRFAPAGTVLLVRACQAPADSPWIPITVRWHKEGQGRSEMGCQFAEELSLNTLALFG